jgi:phosphoglycolate phosphatase
MAPMIASRAAGCEPFDDAYPDPMTDSPRIVLFDIDGTLVSTGGAGAVAWRQAFEELHGIPADIGQFTDAGMTDPDVGAKTFEAVMKRRPTPRELAQLIQRRLEHLPEAVASSEGYRVLPGVPERLRQLSHDGHLLGLITGNGDGAAFVKLARGDLVRWFSFGAYATAGVDRADIVRRAVERGEATLGSDVPNSDIFVVGDTPLDIEAAHAVDCTAIAVATGHYDAEALREAGADHVLETLEEELPLS